MAEQSGSAIFNEMALRCALFRHIKHVAMQITEATVLALLKRHKVNITRNRIRILAAILCMKGAVAASRVLAETSIEADRVTIYRTLKVFERKGMLQLVANTHGKVEFCITPGLLGIQDRGTVHARSICTACGTQSPLNFPDAINMEEIYGFLPSEILIRGLCWSCKSCR